MYYVSPVSIDINDGLTYETKNGIRTKSDLLFCLYIVKAFLNLLISTFKMYLLNSIKTFKLYVP